MRFLQHHSGSAGNLYECISSSGQRLIIDSGVTWAKIEKALKAVDKLDKQIDKAIDQADFSELQ